MWLQQDGAPPHYARAVREHFNESASLTPDLNPLDIFVWCYFKKIVYQGENNTEQELRQKLEFARLQILNRGASRRFSVAG